MNNSFSELVNTPKPSKLALEKLAFLPAALEIQQAPPVKWTRSLLWIIMALLTASVLWACWAQIDIIATAQGKLVPSGQVKVIQPLETGVVKTIFVKEGQHVQTGDKLIALDGTSSQADSDILHNEWQSFKSDLTRQQLFLTKLNNKSTQPQFNKFPLAQQLLFTSSWNEYQAKLDSYQSEIIKLKAQKKATQINIRRLTKTVPLIIERVQSLEKLLANSLVARDQYLELKQQGIEQREALNLEHANLEQINATITSAQQNMQAYQAETRRTTLETINQLTRQAQSTEQELTKANRLTDLRVLTAPVNGIITELAIATIGGVVTPAQELLKIVPEGQQLEVEAGLFNKDIGFVRVGQSAEIKIDSFPFTKYGVIDGEVTDISADAIEDERLGLLFPLNASLATEKILVNGKWINLQAGMSVTVEVKTGKRRLIEFLLAPLLRGVKEGARER
jgi:membrane fusion protein, hemolysin D